MMMARYRQERRVEEPRGRRAEDHRTVGRVEAVGRWLLQPLIVKLALIAVGLATGWVMAIYKLPEGHAQLAKEVKANRAARDSFQLASAADREALHREVDSVRAEVVDLRKNSEEIKLGLCLQQPDDYRVLMRCPPNLPPRRP